MSILNQNTPDVMQETAIMAVKAMQRKMPRTVSITSFVAAMQYIQGIQQWLYDHSAIKDRLNTWKICTIGQYVEFFATLPSPVSGVLISRNNEDVQKLIKNDPYLHHCPDYARLTFSDFRIPVLASATTRVQFMIPKEAEPMSDYITTSFECVDKIITHPVMNVDIICGQHYGFPTQIINIVTKNPAHLFLQNVTEFDRCLGRWEGGDFQWNFPVEDVSIIKSPNIDPRIKQLPYVTIYDDIL